MASPVQSATANGASVSSLTITLVSNATACNTLTVAVGWTDSPARTVSVSDNKGNTWNLVLQTDNGAGAHLATFQAADIAAGATTITITFSGAVTNAAAIGREWSAMAPTADCVDQQLGSFGGSGNPASGSVTTSQSNEAIYGVAISLGSQTLTAGTGFSSGTSATSGTAIKIQDEYQDSPSGAYNGNWTGGGGVAWLAQVATFIELKSQNAVISNAVDNGGSHAWSTPANFASTTNTSVAQVVLTPGNTSNELQGEFNASVFSMPSGAILSGVTLALHAFTTSGGTTGTITEAKVGGTNLAGAGQTVTTTDTLYTFGSVCDSVSISPNGAWNFQIACTSSGGAFVNAYDGQATIYYYTPLALNRTAGVVPISVEVDSPGIGRNPTAGVVQIDGDFAAPYPPNYPPAVTVGIEVDSPAVTLSGLELFTVGVVSIGVGVTNPSVVLGTVSPTPGTVNIGTSVRAPVFVLPGVVEIGTVVHYEPTIVSAGVVDIRVAPTAPAPHQAPGVDKVRVEVDSPSVISGVQFPGAAAVGVEVDSPTPSFGRTGGVVNIGVSVVSPTPWTTIATPGAIGAGVTITSPGVTLAPVSETAGVDSVGVSVVSPAVGGVVVTAGTASVGVTVAGPSLTTQSPGAVGIGVTIQSPAETVAAGVVTVTASVASPSPVASTSCSPGAVLIGVQTVQPPVYPQFPPAIGIGVETHSPGVTLGTITPTAGVVTVTVATAGPAAIWTGAPQIGVGVTIAAPGVSPATRTATAGAAAVGVETDSPTVSVSGVSEAAGADSIGVGVAAPAVPPTAGPGPVAVGVTVAAPTVSATTSEPAGPVAIGVETDAPTVTHGTASATAGAAAIGVTVAAPTVPPDALAGAATVSVAVASPTVSATTSPASGVVSIGVETDAPTVTPGSVSETEGTVAVGVSVASPTVPDNMPPGAASVTVAVASPTVSAPVSQAASVVTIGLGVPSVPVTAGGLSETPGTDAIAVSIAPPTPQVGTATVHPGVVEIGTEADDSHPAISGTASIQAGVVSVEATTSLVVPSTGIPASGAKRVTWIPEARGTLWILPKRSPKVIT